MGFPVLESFARAPSQIMLACCIALSCRVAVKLCLCPQEVLKELGASRKHSAVGSPRCFGNKMSGPCENFGGANLQRRTETVGSHQECVLSMCTGVPLTDLRTSIVTNCWSSHLGSCRYGKSYALCSSSIEHL